MRKGNMVDFDLPLKLLLYDLTLSFVSPLLSPSVKENVINNNNCGPSV